jgi:hypothetical protein
VSKKIVQPGTTQKILGRMRTVAITATLALRLQGRKRPRTCVAVETRQLSLIPILNDIATTSKTERHPDSASDPPEPESQAETGSNDNEEEAEEQDDNFSEYEHETSYSEEEEEEEEDEILDFEDTFHRAYTYQNRRQRPRHSPIGVTKGNKSIRRF